MMAVVIKTRSAIIDSSKDSNVYDLDRFKEMNHVARHNLRNKEIGVVRLWWVALSSSSYFSFSVRQMTNLKPDYARKPEGGTTTSTAQ